MKDFVVFPLKLVDLVGLGLQKPPLELLSDPSLLQQVFGDVSLHGAGFGVDEDETVGDLFVLLVDLEGLVGVLRVEEFFVRVFGVEFHQRGNLSVAVDRVLLLALPLLVLFLFV